jgi:hypothetical protein
MAGVALCDLIVDKMRQLHRFLFLLGIDRAVLLHSLEHIVEPLAGAVWVMVRTIKGRTARQCREYRAFGKRQ